MFKSLKKEQAPDIRAMRYHYNLRVATAVPHYDYQPKQGLIRLHELPSFRNRVLTLSLSIGVLSMAWLLNQPSNASYEPNFPSFITFPTADNDKNIDSSFEAEFKKIASPNPLLQTQISYVDNPAFHAILPISNDENNFRQILGSAATLTETDESDSNQAQVEDSDVSDSETQNGVLQLKVKSGDNLSSIFNRHGLNRGQLHQFLSIKEHNKALRQLRLGQKIEIQHQENGDIDALRLSLDPRHDLLITKPEQEDKFLAEVLDKPITVETVTRTVSIKNSLVSDAKKAGLPHKLTFQLADIFSWDVDFSLGLQKGDYFTVVYEEQYSSEGQKIGFGNILAAEIHNKNTAYQAIRYTDKKGNTAYYNAKGQIMEKTFLRSPVKAGYISSTFSLNRKHPILNTIRAHKGVDYAAPRGTPIYATASGVIDFKGYKNGYGKTVSIDHGQGYETLYGHMSRYAKHISKGKRIKQGELIGYIGSTGLASGPHLHYEFHENGKVKNPLTVKFPSSLSQIAASEKANFKKQTKVLLTQLAQNGAVASK